MAFQKIYDFGNGDTIYFTNSKTQIYGEPIIEIGITTRDTAEEYYIHPVNINWVTAMDTVGKYLLKGQPFYKAVQAIQDYL